MKSISLYSGCGGLDFGLQQAGFKTILACDNDPRCGSSYQRNFPGTAFFEGSATELDSGALTRLAKGQNLKGIQLLAGGPPCPPFSKSRFYRKEKPRALDDALGDATIRAYLSVLADVRPSAFLLENVAGLAYRVHDSALKFIVERAEALGYTVSSKLINAADYGVPQMRERFFVVGMLGRAFEFPAATHAKRLESDLPGGELEPWRTAGQVMGDLDTDANANDDGHFAGGKYHDLLVQIPPGDNYLFFTAKRGHPNPVFEWRSRYWSFLLKLSPDLPSWTIQARRSNNMGPFHWRSRILRIDEIKRLQTFPDDWFLAGTVEQQWRQIGNAVPPLLARELGVALGQQIASMQHEEKVAA